MNSTGICSSLADEGFSGPASVLEGEFGFLRVFCGSEFDPHELTAGLGDSYATRSIMLKRFPCHITAHTSVQAILDLRSEHGYAAAECRLHPHRRQRQDGARQQLCRPR